MPAAAWTPRTIPAMIQVDRTSIQNETGFDPAYSTGIVDSVVALTILAAAAFFYARQKQARP